jgi:hypothetical protein
LRVNGLALQVPTDPLTRFLPVREERLQAVVGERVLEELADHRWRRGHDVGAELGGVVDVDGAAHARTRIWVSKA